MKHLPNTRRLLSMLLSVAMLLSLMVPAVNAAPDAQNATKQLEIEDLDPATLHISKLGEIEENPDTAVEKEPYALTDIVRVSIVLDDAATLDRFSADGVGTNAAAVAYRDSLRAKQDTVQNRIERAIGKSLDVKWNLTLAMNVISANVRYGDLKNIKSVSGVKEVFVENRYEPRTLRETNPTPPIPLTPWSVRFRLGLRAIPAPVTLWPSLTPVWITTTSPSMPMPLIMPSPRPARTSNS